MQKLKQNKILRDFLKYASLNVLGMIGLSCYILADTFFIAKGIGSNGLAALNIAIPAYSFIYGLGLMVGIGAATRYSILKQNKDTEKTNKIFSQAVIFTLILASIFVILGVFAPEQIASLLGASELIVPITTEYLRIIMICAPLFMINALVQSFIRNDGKPNLAMISMIIGSFSNIVLDYVFVIRFGWGMMGAAVATGIAPVVGLLVSSYHFIKKNNNFKFVKTGLHFETIKDMSSLGTGTLVNELSSGIVIMIFNLIIMRISGNIGVAAYSVIANIAVVVISIFTGIAQGIQPLISSSFGRGDNKATIKIYRYGITMSIIFALGIYLTSFFFAEPIVAIFNKDNDPELTRIAVEGIRIYFTAFVFVGVNIITSIFFSSTDRPKPAIAISLLRAFILIVPTTILMAWILSMTGVWLSLPIVEFLTTLIAVAIFIRAKKQMT